MVLAVRQLVDKQVIPAASRPRHRPLPIPPARGRARRARHSRDARRPCTWRLGLDLRTTAMIIEELARGSATLAAIVAAHLTAAHAIARFGTSQQRERFLPPMARGEILGTVAFADEIRTTRAGEDWILDGETPPSITPRTRARSCVAAASPPRRRVVRRRTPHVRVQRRSAAATLGLRASTRAGFTSRVAASHRRASSAVRSAGLRPQRATILDVARLGVAAIGVGLAQAAFEAAPPLLAAAHHLRQADRPTPGDPARARWNGDQDHGRSAPRLRRSRGGRGRRATPRREDIRVRDRVRGHASTRCASTAGYGYTSEFPVERYYRDAARLASTPTTNAADRAELAAD